MQSHHRFDFWKLAFRAFKTVHVLPLNLLKLGVKLKLIIQETSYYLLQVHSLFHSKSMFVYEEKFLKTRPPIKLHLSFPLLGFC